MTKKRVIFELLKRLNQAMDYAGAPSTSRDDIPVKASGRAVWLQKRLDKKNVGRILRGQGMFKLHELPEIAEKLGVRFDWLVSGLGPMTNFPKPLDKPLNGTVNSDLIGRIGAAVGIALPEISPVQRRRLIKALYEELSA